MPPILAPFAHLIRSIQFTKDGTMFLKLKDGFRCQGTPLIVCTSHKAAVERLEIVRPV